MASHEAVPKAEATGSAYEVHDQPEQFPRAELESDYSDLPNIDGQNPSKQRRRHQRGGRKSKKRDVKSVSEFEIPIRQNDEVPEEGPPKRTNPKLAHRDSGSPFETGIKTFNLKRAESSGGRPLGVSIERRGSKSKSRNKAKQKSKCKTCGRRATQIPSVKDTKKDDWESEHSSEEEENEEEDEEGDDEEQEEQEEQEEIEKQEAKPPEKPKKPKKKKPMAIRLDLNLELEIFLRAKIKGDVTITFLE